METTSDVLLYYPLINKTLMVDENRMYQWQLKQHTRRKLGDHDPEHDHCV
jgi:hypothetical protein